MPRMNGLTRVPAVRVYSRAVPTDIHQNAWEIEPAAPPLPSPSPSTPAAHHHLPTTSPTATHQQPQITMQLCAPCMCSFVNEFLTILAQWNFLAYARSWWFQCGLQKEEVVPDRSLTQRLRHQRRCFYPEGNFRRENHLGGPGG